MLRWAIIFLVLALVAGTVLFWQAEASYGRG